MTKRYTLLSLLMDGAALVALVLFAVVAMPFYALSKITLKTYEEPYHDPF